MKKPPPSKKVTDAFNDPDVQEEVKKNVRRTLTEEKFQDLIGDYDEEEDED